MKILLAAREQDSTDNYRAALTACGVEFDVKLHDVDVDEYAGLLLPGGGDIDPARYGEGLNGSSKIDAKLDAGQFEILDKFVKAGKPVFGICRGCQLINVYFGGSLYQDIETAEQHKSHRRTEIEGCSGIVMVERYASHGREESEGRQDIPTIERYEKLVPDENAENAPMPNDIKVECYAKHVSDRNSKGSERVDCANKVTSTDGSLMQEVYGREFIVNSAHYQAVKELGEGLKITLVAEDGVCEAIEHESLPVFAVQWHPERIGFAYKREGVADGEKIFRLFLDVCSRTIKN